jgi:Zn-dependent protease with chaperone function
MDFFEQQARAHRKTKWLVIYFALAVAAMIAAIYVAALLIFSGVQMRRAYRFYNGDQPQFSAWNSQIFFGVSIAVLGIVGVGSAYKTMSLSAGGSAVSELMGGRLINTNTTDPNERKLLNVVEEMSIASGVPMPQVYVMDAENGINAFAAGHKPGDATITVTHGCMRILTRDELQGVIGHEFSHILNGDMRLNLRLMGTIFGILCLAIIGRILLQSGGRRNNAGLPLLGVVLLIVGYIGVFFGRLIQAAVSRQREFLADASSVQFTRNPGGITGALKKIGGLGEMGSRLDHAHAEELSHMFFGNGVSEPFIGLLETHPPLAERIKIFDPAFDGTFPEVRYDDETERKPQQTQRPPRMPLPNIFDAVLGGAILADGSEPPVIKPHAVLPILGNPTPLHLQYAEQLRDSMPDSVRAAAREPSDAMALVYAMLLSNDENQRTQQLVGLEQCAGAAISQKAAALFSDVSQAAAHAHLPMLTIAIGALKQLDRDQYDVFSKTLNWLINSDGKVEVFEFVLQKIVLRHLDSRFHGATKPITQYYSVKPLAPDCSVVLSALAIAGSKDGNEIQKAFDAGAPYLRAPQESELGLLSSAQCGVQQLDDSLNRLVLAAPIIKKNLIEACVYVVGADGVILESEAELLRAVCDTLDCPMPPLI